MSYFKVKCPWCGAEYMTGVVGKTLMGSHTCHGSKPCEHEGCPRPGVFQVMYGERFEFRCSDHIEDGIICMAQGTGKRAEEPARG